MSRFTLGRIPMILAIVIGLIVPVIPVGAATAGEQQAAAASGGGWLARHIADPSTVIGVGSLADVVFSLATAGNEPEASQDAMTLLTAGAPDYIGELGAINIGGTAKVILARQVQGLEAASLIPGRDLEAELRATLTVDGIEAGRFGGSTQLFIQAFAILALSRTGGGVPPSASAWLANVQCDSGEYSWNGACPGPGNEDPDTTGLVLQALLASGRCQAAAEAVDWLLEIQGDDGSFQSFGLANANSTALAGSGLRAAGETAAADLAADAMIAWQFGSDAANPNDVGGFRWIDSDLEPNAFASYQAILGLGADPLHLLVASGVPAPAPIEGCDEPPSDPGPSPVTPTTEAFSDVADGHMFFVAIQWLVNEKITVGCGVNRFCPEDAVTRGQMAAFVTRAFHLPAVGAPPFSDSIGHEFAGAIASLAAAGITSGCGGGQFCPDQPITRGQIAVFLTAALHLPASMTAPPFGDTVSHPFSDAIARIAAAGVTLGCGGGNFCPDLPVSRGQFAALLFRAIGQP